MKLDSLLTALPQYKKYGEGNPEIFSIEMDSRTVKQGSLFICIKGFTVDGHDYAADAAKKGASAIISEKKLEGLKNVPVVLVPDTKRAMAMLADFFYGQPTHNIHLIGVTGTNGKTTTTHIIEHIFRTAGYQTGLIGTMYTKIGDQQYEVKNTTPDNLTLQKTFRQMVDEHVTHAAMEVSSHALHMGRVYGCDFDVAVFTNLSQDHLDYHKTMEEYRTAKGLLFAQLGNRYDRKHPKFAVLNGDDPASEYYKHMTSAPIVTYGIEKPCDIMAANIEMKPGGTFFEMVTPEGTFPIRMKLLGTFSVYNVLAAVSACLVSGVDLNIIIEAVQTMEGVRGRFELVDCSQDFSVIVDYAHTPDSLENVLKTVKEFCEGKVFVVIGCGGDRDRTKRPLMAQIAVKWADEAIFTSDNPRSEDPQQILKEMETGVIGKHFHSILDRKEAILFAIQNAKKGDVVLVAGKGHETYQQIGNEKFDFDDREVAVRAIQSVVMQKGKEI